MSIQEWQRYFQWFQDHWKWVSGAVGAVASSMAIIQGVLAILRRKRRDLIMHSLEDFGAQSEQELCGRTGIPLLKLRSVMHDLDLDGLVRKTMRPADNDHDVRRIWYLLPEGRRRK